MKDKKLKDDQNQSTSTNYFTAKDKHFLAVYYNIALHNVFITLNHIFRKHAITEFNDESGMSANLENKVVSFEQNADAIERKKFYDSVHKHFPFLEKVNVMTSRKRGENSAGEFDKEDLSVLVEFINILSKQRNYQSHFIYKERITVETKVQIWLNFIFDANVRQVKEDFFGANVSRGQGNDPFEHYFSHLRRRVKKGNKMIDNPAFKLSFFNQDESGELDFKIHGHVFFCSLFMDKRSSVLMQRKVRGLKASQEKKYQMTTEVMCRSRIRLPRIRLESSNIKDALALDMANELSKAPEQFYNQLTNEGKDKFRNLTQSSLLDETNNTDSNDIQAVQSQGKRSKDRFSYFALRFFDEVHAFKELRFQVDLGNYYFHIYEAKIDGERQKRQLKKKLFGYDRLGKFDLNEVPETWGKLLTDTEFEKSPDAPYIRKTYPHYHIAQGKIGIRFTKENDPLWPNVNVESVPTSKYPKYNRESHEYAVAFLSENELPAMMFYHHLLRQGKLSKDFGIESLIRKKYCGIQKLFNDVQSPEFTVPRDDTDIWLSETYELNKSEIPKRLYNYLLKENQNVQNLAQKAQNRMLDLISETESRMKHFEQLKNATAKTGSKRYRRLESGKFADWLIRDLMLFQPVLRDKEGAVLNRSKANVVEYQLIQKSLALYKTESHRLTGLFRACNLIGKSNPHPFLEKVTQRDHKTWQLFYKDYLEERLQFLNKANKKAVIKNSFEPCHYFLNIKPQNASIGAIAKEGWLNQVLLPRDLFYQPIIKWFSVHRPELLKEVELENKRVQLHKLVEKFVTHEFNDHEQPFYKNLPLIYSHYVSKNPMGLTYDERKRQMHKWQSAFKADKEKTNPYLEENKPLQTERIPKKLVQTAKGIRDFKFFLSNERELLDIKMKDQLLSLCVSQLMAKGTSSSQKPFKLNEIAPIGEYGVSNFMNQVQHFEFEFPFFKSKENGSLDKPKKQIGVLKVFSDHIKRKNLGNFHQFIKDRRINNLAQYINTEEAIDLKFLEKELQLYDRNRQEVVQLAHEIEGRINILYPELWEDESFLHFKQLLQEKITEKVQISDTLIRQIILLRNAFLHNQYPRQEDFQDEISLFYPQANNNPVNGLGIANQFLEYATITMKKLNNLISNNGNT